MRCVCRSADAFGYRLVDSQLLSQCYDKIHDQQISNRTDAWKPDVNFLTGFPVWSQVIKLENGHWSSVAELGSSRIRDIPKFQVNACLFMLVWAILFYVVVRRLCLYFRFREYYERPLLTVGNQTFPNPRIYKFSTAYWHTLAAKLFFVVAFLVIR